MRDKNFTTLYVAIPKDDDDVIDRLRVEKIRADKKHYNKTTIIQELINLGLDIKKGLYIKLDPNIDDFVKKLQVMNIKVGSQKIEIKKTKEQIYTMLIEKGLENLSDDTEN